MSVVPSRYWPPRVRPAEVRRVDRAVGVFADAVMHDGAVRAAPEIVSKLISRSALVARRNPSSSVTTSISVSPPLGASASSQARNSHHRRGVAQMGGAGALRSRSRSCGPWAGGRGRHRGTGVCWPAPAWRGPFRAGIWDQSVRGLSGLGRRPETGFVVDRDGDAEVICQIGGLAGAAVEFAGRVVKKDRKGLRHGVAFGIAATNVQKPRDAVGQRQDRSLARRGAGYRPALRVCRHEIRLHVPRDRR